MPTTFRWIALNFPVFWYFFRYTAAWSEVLSPDLSELNMNCKVRVTAQTFLVCKVYVVEKSWCFSTWHFTSATIFHCLMRLYKIFFNSQKFLVMFQCILICYMVLFCWCNILLHVIQILWSILTERELNQMYKVCKTKPGGLIIQSFNFMCVVVLIRVL